MTFRDEVEKGLGAVVILAGSGSDRAHVKSVYEAVRKYGLPVEARVASAHKQSIKVLAILDEYDKYKGPLAYIAVAGGTDALSGQGSWVTNRPVLTCPPDHPNQSGLTNPPGSSNARLVAQIFSYWNPVCAEALEKDRQKKLGELERDDGLFKEGNFEEPPKKVN
jgi:phosphoribosylcarboxyaminoimidazole (NCAIR) mutase